MDVQTTNSRRKILTHAICNMLTECGFESCEKGALETLTELLQSLLFSIGESARNYCELSGRTEILVADIVLALVNSGIKLDNIQSYGLRSNRTKLPPLQLQTQTKQLNILQAGVKQSHPPHIPSHLPPLPDPHAYVRTPTHKQPVTEYEAIREKAAAQKRDIERALTRFTAKTGKTHTLFKDDNSMFPLIACAPQFPSYVAALLPQDQIFDSDSETETSPVKKKKEKEPDPKTKDGVKQEGNNQDDNMELNEENNTQTEVIDNPYLRPGKIPKNKNTTPSKSTDRAIDRLTDSRFTDSRFNDSRFTDRPIEKPSESLSGALAF